MDDAPIPLDLERKRAGKSRAPTDVEDLIRATHPNIDSVEVEDVLMNRLEIEETNPHIATEDYYMAMTICEEVVDMSCMKSRKAKMLNEAIGCTDVGPVRSQLNIK